MPAPILLLDSIRLTFGGAPLLWDASLSVHRNDRICLVGRNGSGKSTFLSVAAGLTEADSGTRFVQPGVTHRTLPQEPDLSTFETVGDYVAAGLGPGDDPNMARYFLDRLGLSGDENPTTISGGEKRRAALARVLAPAPDILFLDEPTNHLDLPAIEWLERELTALSSALVIVSHDRRFLQKLSRKTVWLDRGATRTLDRGFAEFEEWRDALLEQEITERHKLDREIDAEEQWIIHGVSGRRRRNMRRVAELAELREKRGVSRSAPGSVLLSQAQAARSGKLVADLSSVTKSFGDRTPVKDFSVIIHRGDRVGIVGPNGAGKTTLVRLITGQLQPDSGNVRIGANLELTRIDQNREALNERWTLSQTLTGGAGEIIDLGHSKKHVMSYMKDFLFLPEQAGTPVFALSGGERARLLLASGLARPSNLLVLDEPTNDLDLETLDLLQEFIAGYEGTVVLVSHDRDFLDRICTSVVASDGDGAWREYAGGYSDMVAQKGSGVAERPMPLKRTGARRERGGSGDGSARQDRMSYKHKHALEKLPGQIAAMENTVAKLKEELSRHDLYTEDRKRFENIAISLAEHEARLAQMEDEWLELELLREQIEQGKQR
jgi:ABC transport system ATP-binding/permease protein